MEVLALLPPRMRALVESPVWWEVVEEVREVERESYVYDLDMRPLCNFMVGPGLIVHNTFEDAIVVSETAAKKLSSEHLYQERSYAGRDTVLNRDKFRAHFPDNMDNEQAKKLDAEGVITPGTRVGPGDTLVASMRQVELSREQMLVRGIHKAISREFADTSLRWEKTVPGVVEGVFRSGKEIKVHVSTVEPLQIGDKLCYSEDHELLTTDGWKPVASVTLTDRLLSRDPNTGAVEPLCPATVLKYPHDGRMYRLETPAVSMCVTEEHKLFASPDGVSFALMRARDLFGRGYWLETALTGSAPYEVSPTSPDRSESWEYYVGDVFCVELPRHHTLYTRRNGKAHWSGNSDRHGGKGVVGTILSDAEMPRDAAGNPMEIILDPAGVAGRMNVGQILETVVGKVAHKDGKPIAITNFESDPSHRIVRVGGHWRTVKTTEGAKKVWIDPYEYERDYHTLVQELADEAGVSDREVLYDPITGAKIAGPDGKGVLTGYKYILKLEHMSEKKLLSRGHGAGLNYDANQLPKSGGKHGAQSIGALGIYALLAHGDTDGLLREMHTVKSDRGADDFWTALQSGEALPTPRAPFVYQKFMAYLAALGVNVEKRGSELHLLPSTDAEVLERSHGELKRPNLMITGKDARPEAGGLFDPDVTGGMAGTQWSHIRLNEPVPNPLFQKAIQSLLGLTGTQFSNLIDGELGVTKDGALVPAEEADVQGGTAVAQMLDRVDVDRDLKKAEEELKGARASKLDAANRKVRYLRALKKAGLTAREAYVMNVVPVLPPTFRPLSILESGDINDDDLNGLYKQLALVNQQLGAPSEGLPEFLRDPLRADLYDAAKSLMGLGGRANAENAGILDIIHGKKGPKEGFIQKQILGRKQDMTMRGVIVPGADLGLDEIGLPRKAAMEMYRPLVVAELVKSGYMPNEARALTRADSVVAQDALKSVVDSRPVLFKRDPALHKFSVMAFKPRLVDGSAIQIHPLVTGGFNADFDGDSYVGEILACIPPSLWDKMPTDVKEDSVPHITDVAAMQVLDIADFPRVEDSVRVNETGRVFSYDVPEGVRVPAFLQGEIRLMPVSEFSIHKDCEAWVVETANDRALTVSADHSLAILNPDTLEVERRRPADSIGLCLPVMRGLPHVAPLALQGERPTAAGRGNSNLMADTLDVSRDLGWFIGATVGDGWASGIGSRQLNLAYGTGGEEVVDEWIRVSEKIVPTAAISGVSLEHDFEGGTYTSGAIRVSSTLLSRWIQKQIGHGARNKHLPEGFLEWPLDARQGLFCGLIDTDGTACWNASGRFAMSYTTTSGRLVKEVRLLGLSIGLHGGVCEYENRDKPAWIVTFSVRAVQDADWIHLFHQAKKVALDELRGGRQVDFGRNDFVPLPEAVREELLSLLRAKGVAKRTGYDPGMRSQYMTLMKRQPYLTRESLLKILESIKDDQWSAYLEKWLTLVCDTSIGWDLVTKAEPTGERITMYDMTVPDAWTFCTGDGAIVWDTMSIYVPVTQEAVKEAWNLLPSNNLWNPATGVAMYQPTLEGQVGLYGLTVWGEDKGRKFTDGPTLLKAAKARDVPYDEVVHVGGTKTTAGRLLAASLLPEGFDPAGLLSDPKSALDKKNLQALMKRLATEKPGEFPRVIDQLSRVGFTHAYEQGVTLHMDDLKPLQKIRTDALKRAATAIEAARKKGVTGERLKDVSIAAWDTATKEMVAEASNGLRSNNLFRMGEAGLSKPGMDQIRQMILAPMLLQDAKGRTIPIPVTRSYSEGMDVSDYWIAASGVRKGVIDKTQEVQKPGYLSKQIANTVIDTTITEKDCGTDRGILLPSSSRDILDRYTAGPVKVSKGLLPAGTLITPEVLNTFRVSGVDKVNVRSPLKCRSARGMCARCFGVSVGGKTLNIRDNVGVMAGTALGERAVQIALKCAHDGNLVTVRKDEGPVQVLPFRAFWEAAHSFVDVDDVDGQLVETKMGTGWEIWDVDGWTEVLTIQRHPPAVDMVMVRTEDGAAFVVQADHPCWGRERVAACTTCGRIDMQFVGHQRVLDGRPPGTTVLCRECGTRQVIDRALYEGNQERVVLAADLEGLEVRRSVVLPDDRAWSLPVSPYLAGMFLAEGCVCRTRDDRRPGTGQKRRGTTPFGMRWYIQGLSVAQNQGPIRERIKSELSAAGFGFRECPVGVLVDDTALARVFWEFGIGSRNKALPGSCSLSDNEARHLLAGLLDGDGSVGAYKDVNVDSTSWALISQIRLLCEQLGYRSRIDVTTIKALTRNQGYRIVFYPTERLPSLKEHRVSEKGEVGTHSTSKVIAVKIVEYYDRWTYDVSTKSRSYVCNGVHTHNSFHVGGVRSPAAAGLTRFDRLNQLLMIPEKLPGAATLSTESGTVEHTRKDPAGGWQVTVSGTDHYVPATLDLKVQKGDRVVRGHPLSSGVSHPRELLALTDLPTVQNYLTDAMADTYEGQGLSRRNFEVVVKAMTDLVEVGDAGDHPDLVRGDNASASAVASWNKENRDKTQVKAHPVLKGLNQLPLEISEDWMARLNYKGLKNTLTEGASKGWVADTHGIRPIAGLIQGSEFGESPADKPWAY